MPVWLRRPLVLEHLFPCFPVKRPGGLIARPLPPFPASAGRFFRSATRFLASETQAPGRVIFSSAQTSRSGQPGRYPIGLPLDWPYQGPSLKRGPLFLIPDHRSTDDLISQVMDMRYRVDTWVYIREYILNDPPWEYFMDRYMSVINILMWLLVWIVLRPEVITVPYIRSCILWYRQTSPITGWTIKSITGYAINFTKGCEWCRWNLSLPYDGSNICGPLN